MSHTPPRAISSAAVLVALLVACAAPEAGRDRVLLVTTTSIEASGLLDEILEAYHASQTRYRLAPTAVGSGAALELGRRGDADLLLTHHPEGERAFAAEGHALEQGPVLMNDFVLVGPAEDPAGIAEARDPVEALGRIEAKGTSFISRGDDSGTHARERALWEAAGLTPWAARPQWYVEAGTGAAEALLMASQVGAYTLTDRGSFLHLRSELRLRVLLEGGDRLENRYRYTLPRDIPNPEGTRDFLAWLTGPGQQVIARYGAEEFGEPLFRPTADR